MERSKHSQLRSTLLSYKYTVASYNASNNREVDQFWPCSYVTQPRGNANIETQNHYIIA